MSVRTWAAGLVLLLGACEGGRRERFDRAMPEVDPASPRKWQDVQDVIWREWGKATWEEVALGYRLRDQEQVAPEEALVLLYLARALGQSVGTIAEHYRKQEKNLHALGRELQVPRDAFFVPIPESMPLPPGVLARPYKLYRMRQPGTLTQEEYGALVVMRVAVDYFGFDAEEYFKEIERVRAFESLLTGNLERAGAGGKAADGSDAPLLERPWVAETRSLFERARKDALGKP
jgi:hypothetical protein